MGNNLKQEKGYLAERLILLNGHFEMLGYDFTKAGDHLLNETSASY
jgi:hypothetical protein